MLYVYERSASLSTCLSFYRICELEIAIGPRVSAWVAGAVAGAEKALQMLVSDQAFYTTCTGITSATLADYRRFACYFFAFATSSAAIFFPAKERKHPYPESLQRLDAWNCTVSAVNFCHMVCFDSSRAREGKIHLSLVDRDVEEPVLLCALIVSIYMSSLILLSTVAAT
jgi:hypothetical protein